MERIAFQEQEDVSVTEPVSVREQMDTPAPETLIVSIPIASIRFVATRRVTEVFVQDVRLDFVQTQLRVSQTRPATPSVRTGRTVCQEQVDVFVTDLSIVLVPMVILA